MSRKGFVIVLSILAAVMAALVVMIKKQDSRVAWDVSYRMTNQRIEWTGAGSRGK